MSPRWAAARRFGFQAAYVVSAQSELFGFVGNVIAGIKYVVHRLVFRIGGGVVGQPLTAPERKPWVTCFCSTTKTMITGRIVISVPAASGPMSMERPPRKR